MMPNRTTKSSSCTAHRLALHHAEQWPIAIAAVAVHVAVAAVTWRDIARRDASDVRGPKNLWRVASAVNSLGSIAYWAFARIAAPASIEHLSDEQALRLLEETTIGRVAISQLRDPRHDGPADDASGIDIFPVNYLVHDGAIYFRSGPGSKLMEIAANPTVVFEIDGHRGATHWSVVVHGRAERLALDHDIESSRIHELVSTHPTEMSSFVRIVPESISGRRFRHPRHGLMPQRSTSSTGEPSITPGSQHPAQDSEQA